MAGLVDDSLGYRGIGGGENLPLQWSSRELDIYFVGAGHGHISRDVAALFTERLDGQVTKIPSLAKLPELLIQALVWIAGGSLR